MLKGSLGVKRTTTNWAVLRECGHQPLQYYGLRAAVKLSCIKACLVRIAILYAALCKPIQSYNLRMTSAR
eukprot:973741-Pelagomonas_calceolata.AAC.1